MQITFHFFGQLAELTGGSSAQLDVEMTSVGNIRKKLIEHYPELNTMSFQLAADNAILREDESITTHEVDVFPPFSGG